MARSLRRKAPAQAAPATREEALALIAEYRAMDEAIQCATADYERAVQDARDLRDVIAQDMKPRMDELFGQLRAWWAVAGEAETGGRRKSVELGGMLIGERTTPPALALPKGVNEAAAIKAILNLPLDGAAGCVVVTEKLNKPALLARLRAGPLDLLAEALRALGFAARQREEFFIDRPPPREPEVELVALPDATPTGGVA